MRRGDPVHIGNGFGCVLRVNGARGIVLVLFQNGATYEVPLALAKEGAAALNRYEAALN